MSRRGWPQALFTFNLWGWQDRPQRAHQLRSHVRRFHVGLECGSRALAPFANLMLRAYGPEIEWLQDEKLRILAGLQRRRPGVDVLADRSIELPSALVIDVRARPEGREPGVPSCPWGHGQPPLGTGPAGTPRRRRA